jgi:hypothetical protein
MGRKAKLVITYTIQNIFGETVYNNMFWIGDTFKNLNGVTISEEEVTNNGWIVVKGGN